MIIMPHGGQRRFGNAGEVRFSVIGFADLLGNAGIVPTQAALVAAQGSERSSTTASESVEACRVSLRVAGGNRLTPQAKHHSRSKSLYQSELPGSISIPPLCPDASGAVRFRDWEDPRRFKALARERVRSPAQRD
jgi:hypothetical protein